MALDQSKEQLTNPETLTNLETLRKLAWLEARTNQHNARMYFGRIWELSRQDTTADIGALTVLAENLAFNSYVIRALTQLAQSLAFNQKGEEAMSVALQSLSLAESKLDENFGEISDAMVSLGRAQITAGNLNESERLLKLSYAIKTTDRFDLSVIPLLWAYKDWFLACNERTKADAVEEFIYKRYGGQCFPMASNGQMKAFKAYRQAVSYEKEKKFHEAAQCYLEALDLADHDPQSYLQDQYEFAASLIDVYIEEGKTSDAEQLIKKRLEGLSEPIEGQFDYRVGYLGRYARLLYRLGKPQEAAEMESRAMALRAAEMSRFAENSSLSAVLESDAIRQS